MDDNYLRLIDDLYQIKPEIDLNSVNELENKIEKMWTGECNKTMNYYKVMWHLI